MKYFWLFVILLACSGAPQEKSVTGNKNHGPAYGNEKAWKDLTDTSLYAVIDPSKSFAAGSCLPKGSKPAELDLQELHLIDSVLEEAVDSYNTMEKREFEKFKVKNTDISLGD